MGWPFSSSPFYAFFTNEKRGISGREPTFHREHVTGILGPPIVLFIPVILCSLEDSFLFPYYFQERNKVPGVIGISNHGNTCFINSILQCLSYTDLFSQYFVMDAYKSDLRRKRRLAHLTEPIAKRVGQATSAVNSSAPCGAAAANGGKGEVTEQLATLLKSLWSLQYEPEISSKFKALVEKNASQYNGSSQHDAQEFLLWLLDQVHEDLNQATKKKYKPAVKSSSNSSGQGASGPAEVPSDETLAAESLANYMRCNNSFVMDLFQVTTLSWLFSANIKCVLSLGPVPFFPDLPEVRPPVEHI